MRYSSYKIKYASKIKKLNILFKLRYVFVAVGASAIALTTTLLGIKGNVGETTTDKDVYTVGEEINIDSSALMNDYFIQYALKNSDTWTTSVPYRPGEYKARAVSTSGFGSTKYGNETYFTIVPADLKLPISSTSITYGNKPTLDLSDATRKQLKLDSVDFTYGSKFDETNPFEDKETFVESISMKKDQVKIFNKDGIDVTDCYKIISEPKELTISKRELVIDISSESKSYDKEELATSRYEVNPSYSLAFSDEIKSSNPSKITEIGSADATMDFKIVRGEQDRSAFYNIHVNKGSLVINKRQITLTTNSINRPYNGNRVCSGENPDDNTLAYSLEGDSLLKGHKLINANFTHEGEFITSSSGYNSMNTSLIDIVEESDPTVSVMDCYHLQYNFGTFNIYRRDLFVKFYSETKSYDGNGINGSYEILNGSLAQGDIAHYDIQNKDQSIGSLYYGAIAIYNEDISPDEITSQCYNVYYETGHLNIQKRKLKISTNRVLKTKYDGDKLSSNKNTPEKDRLTYTIESGSLLQGHDLQISFDLENQYVVNHQQNSLTIDIKQGGVSVKDLYYEIETTFPMVNIEKRSVNVVFNTNSHTYDGHDYQVPHVVSGDNIVDSDDLIIENDTVTKDPGNKEFHPSVRIERNGVDVSNEYYSLFTSFNDVYINPKPITITTKVGDKKDFSGTYDGKTYSVDSPDPSHKLNYEVTGLLPGHEISSVHFDFEGQYEPYYYGTNSMSYSIIDTQSGAHVETLYSVDEQFGSFTIKTRPLSFTFGNTTKQYDGTVLSPTITGSGLVNGDTVDPLSTSSEYVNDYVFNTSAITIYSNEHHTDVTHCYNFDYEQFTLSITKRKITIVSQNIEKIYDSQGLVVGSGVNDLRTTITSGSVLTSLGHHLSISYTSLGNYEANEQGYKNEFSVTVLDAFNNPIDDLYEVNTQFGTITIHKRDLYLTHTSTNYIYDNQAHTPQISGDYSTGLQSNDNLTLNSYVNTGSYSGEGLFNITHTTDSTNAKSNYNIHINSGSKMVIEPIHIRYYLCDEVEGDTFTKTYDSYPITIDQLTPSIEYVNSTLPDHYTAEVVLDDNQDLETYTPQPKVFGYHLVIKYNGEPISGSALNNFIIEKNTSKTPSKYRIDKRDLHIDDGMSLIYTYDGEFHSRDYYWTQIEGTVDYISAQFNNGVKYYTGGDQQITPSSLEIYNSKGDRSFCYNITYDFGSIRIDKRELTIVLNPYPEKTYDGYEINKYEVNWFISGPGKPSTDVLSYDIGGLYKYVTPSSGAELTFKNVRVTNGGEDATNSYNITVVPSTYKITPRPIDITANSYEKVFDGESIPYSDYASCWIGGYGLTSFDTIDVSYRSDIDTYNWGIKENEIMGVTINEMDYSTFTIVGDVTDQYDISTYSGTITINQRVIRYSFTDRQFTYGQYTYGVKKDIDLSQSETGVTYAKINNWGSTSESKNTFLNNASIHAYFEHIDGAGEVSESSSQYSFYRADGGNYMFNGVVVVQVGNETYRSDNNDPEGNVVFMNVSDDDILTYRANKRNITIANAQIDAVFFEGTPITNCERITVSNLLKGDVLYIGNDIYEVGKSEYQLIDLNGRSDLAPGLYHFGASFGDVIDESVIRVYRKNGNQMIDVTGCYSFNFNFTNIINIDIQ